MTWKFIQSKICIICWDLNRLSVNEGMYNWVVMWSMFLVELFVVYIQWIASLFGRLVCVLFCLCKSVRQIIHSVQRVQRGLKSWDSGGTLSLPPGCPGEGNFWFWHFKWSKITIRWQYFWRMELIYWGPHSTKIFAVALPPKNLAAPENNNPLSHFSLHAMKYIATEMVGILKNSKTWM